MVQIFLAGSFASQKRLYGLSQQLRLFYPSVNVNARWLDEQGPCDSSVREITIAMIDREDMDKSDIMILDTLQNSTRGSRYWEAGYMTAQGKPVVMIGPPTNPYLTAFVNVRFNSWGEFFKWFRPYVALRGKWWGRCE